MLLVQCKEGKKAAKGVKKDMETQKDVAFAALTVRRVCASFIARKRHGSRTSTWKEAVARIY